MAALVVALLTGAVPAAAAAPPRRAAAKLAKVRVAADASVRSDRRRTPAGAARTLRVDGSPQARAYLRFRLTGLSGRVVTKASLWVHLARRERWRGVTAAATNRRAWSEKRLTWNRRPAAGPAVGRVAPASGRWKKIDVTGLVRANGRLDIVLRTTRTTGVLLSSRQAGRRFAPRLHLITALDAQPSFPVRAAFYSSGYPDAWDTSPTVYHPRLGHYDGDNPYIRAAHEAELTYGGFQAAITAWEGPGTPSDARLTDLLDTANTQHSPLRWAAAPTSELTGTPTPAAIARLLLGLDTAHARDPAYLRMRGRPVIFVGLAAGDGCGALRRWVKGNARQRFYLVFQTWPGYEACTGATPSDRFTLTPDAGPARVGRSSYAISPGFFSSAETVARKPRDLPRFYADVRGMAGSRARWQLVDSFNDWGSGTAVEPATEWASPSGNGQYLDALHANGVAPAETTTVAAAVGDIGCSISEAAANQGSTVACQEQATANLAKSLDPSFVITMGDDMHGQATLADYQARYTPAWGALRPITYPAVGNHQYCSYQCADPVAAVKAGYFTYWGARAGTPGQGWYSYDRGGWHIIVLNSECKEQGGCSAGSPMETWLKADLAAHPTACTLAYWHRPRFTGGHEGEAPSMGPIWSDLYRAGVELVLNGHQHQYERFAAQAPDRAPDASGGITEIVSGTGGRSHIAPVTVRANTVVQNANTFGVIRLELRPLSWSARFLPAPGLGSFTDSAGGDCH